MARNQGEAFWMQHAQGTSANASIIGPNVNTPTVASDNCDLGSQGAPFSSGSWNVANDSTCGLTDTTNRQNTEPLVAGALTNQGGDTDVLTIPANSPAVDLVTPCNFPADQRLFTRFETTGQPCDAGAYEQSGVGGGPEEPTPTPTPTPIVQPAQTPTPTATPSPEPTPVANQTVVAREVRGTIRVRERGSNRFVDLDASKGIPVGSTVDAKRGTVEITVGRPAAREGAVPRRHLPDHAVARDHRPQAHRGAQLPAARASAAQQEAEEAQAVGQGHGQVPHHRQLQRRHRSAAPNGSSRTPAPPR